jgi:hypothetical protein
MRHYNKTISGFFCLGLLFFAVCLLTACSKSPSSTPPPLKAIDSNHGGKIVYGLVDGANSQAAALASVLRSVSNSCGERPQVGNVFRVRGTNSDAVFFTVVNHPAGNKNVAGMIIASQSGPGRVEAAMVSNEASRFGSTVNGMLQQLFSVWRPGEAAAAPVAAPEPAQSAGAGSEISLPSMQRVTLRDNTASVALPAGWNIDPKMGGGGMIIFGPRGEKLHINMWVGADDPNGPHMRRLRQTRIKPNPQRVLYPANVNLAKAYPDIYQRIRATNGLRPTALRVDSARMVEAPRGFRCAMVSGQLNFDGSGMRDFIDILCATSPDQYGSYRFQVSGGVLTSGASDQDRAIALAIINSFQVNEQLVKQRANAESAPVIAAMQKNYQAQQQQLMARHQKIIGNYKQIGANATARYNATQAANEAQHRAWRDQQNVNSGKINNFSNYLLDQSIVRDTHDKTYSTEWNRTADAMVKINPNRYEIVNDPNYWQGHRF